MFPNLSYFSPIAERVVSSLSTVNAKLPKVQTAECRLFRAGALHSRARIHRVGRGQVDMTGAQRLPRCGFRGHECQTLARSLKIRSLYLCTQGPYPKDKTSAKFWDFLTPPPLVRAGQLVYNYKIHATSLTLSGFPLPPPPPSARTS